VAMMSQFIMNGTDAETARVDSATASAVTNASIFGAVVRNLHKVRVNRPAGSDPDVKTGWEVLLRVRWKSTGGGQHDGQRCRV